MLYNCKLKTAKLSLYCKMRQISSRFFSRKGWQFSRKEFIIFFTYTASYFHVCKFGENFTQRIDFSRTLLKIFSRTGTHFHARKLIFFHARETVFHGGKKNTGCGCGCGYGYGCGYGCGGGGGGGKRLKSHQY